MRLENITRLINDGTHSTPHYTETGIPFLSVRDISSGTLDFSNTKYISVEEHAILSKRTKPEMNDILLSKVGTTGIPVKVDTDKEFSIFVSLALLKFTSSINVDFMVHLIKSPVIFKQSKLGTRGVGNKNLVLQTIKNFLFPLPPLSEQQRIVEAIESALEKVDEYAESYNILEQLDKEFPDKLKKSILQYAMQGKLVDQDPNDESVEVLLEKIRAEKQKLFEEGKIKKKDLEESIIYQGDDNSYYEEVPNTWQLLKLKNLLQLDNGTKQQNEHLIYWDAKTLRGIKDAEFKEKGNKVHSKDTVILVDGENSGELFIIPHDGYMGSTFKKIHYLEAGSKKYIDLYIDSKKELLKNSKTGSAIPHLNKTLFKELIVALPPIQEQKRISSKITQIFSQINRLI